MQMAQIFGRALIATLALLAAPAAHAQLAVTNNTNATALAHQLLDPCGLAFDSASGNFSTNTFGAAGSGTFTIGPSPNTYGLLLSGSNGGGIVLSTGDAFNYGTGPSTAWDFTTQYNTGGTAAEKLLMQPLMGTTALRDVSHLTINITVAEATVMRFAYVYGTEEYPQWVGSEFTDAFGIFHNGVNIALPGGTPANVNNTCMSPIAGTELNGVIACGGAPVQIATANLTPGLNVLEFIIADATDTIRDSTAYIRCLCDWSAPPVFTLQPVSIAVPCKSAFTQHVEAEADCGIFYTWEVAPCAGGGGFTHSLSDSPGVVTGSQTPQVTFEPAGVVQYSGCSIRAVAHVPGGAFTYSNPFVITVATPTITQQPVTAFGCPPDPMTFTIAASGPSLQYQWFTQCPGAAPVAIPGATSTTLDNNYPAHWYPRTEDCGCDVFCRVTHPICGTTESDHALIQCCECVMPPPNMALWLTFDETSGSVCGNAVSPYKGVCYPAGMGPSAYPGSYCNSCRFFDGTDDAVRVSHHSLIDMTTGDFSIDAWVYREGGGDGPVELVNKLNPALSALGYSLFVVGGQLAFQMSDGNGAAWVAPGTAGAVPMGVWKHVAVTVDRDDTAGGHLYVDGVDVLAFNPTGNSGTLSNQAPLLMGCAHNGTNHLHGFLDEVEIFRRALTAQEVSSLYAAKGSGKCKQYCQVVQPSSFCQTSTGVTVSAWYFNHTQQTQNITPSMTWVPLPTGCFAGPWAPADAIAPLSPISVAPFGSAYLTAFAPKPIAMTTPFAMACFDTQIITGNGKILMCSGFVRDQPNIACSSACWNCPIWAPVDGSTFTAIPIGIATKSLKDVPFHVTAFVAGGGVNPAVSIAGLPPGVPYTGLLSASAGSEFGVEFELSYAEVDSLSASVLVLEWDDDHDGTFDVIGAMPLMCHVAGPSPDLNGDGQVDGVDLGFLLGSWGTQGESLADLDLNELVDGADLGTLLGAWGPVP